MHAYHWRRFIWQPPAIQKKQKRFNRAMGIQQPHFKASIAQYFPGQLDEIESPQPLDEASRA